MGKNFLIDFFNQSQNQKLGLQIKEKIPLLVSPPVFAYLPSNPFLPSPCSSAYCSGADSTNHISQASLANGFPLASGSGMLWRKKPRHLSSSLSVIGSSSGRGFVCSTTVVCTGQCWLLGSGDTTSTVCSSTFKGTVASCNC